VGSEMCIRDRVYWPGTHRANMEKRMERWAFEAWGDLGGEKGG